MRWRYIIRFQKGSIPSIDEEYEELVRLESHAKSGTVEGKKATYECNYVKGIHDKGIMINVEEDGEELKIKDSTRRNVMDMGWSIDSARITMV